MYLFNMSWHIWMFFFDHSDQTAAIKMYEKPGCSGKMRKNGYGGRRQKGIESEGILR